jgi:hypothetical protein
VIAKNFYPRDQKAIAAALFHIRLDEMCSIDPLLHAWLKKGDKSKIKKRKINTKKQKKKKEALHPEFRQFMQDLEKMMEILRLANDLC